MQTKINVNIAQLGNVNKKTVYWHETSARKWHLDDKEIKTNTAIKGAENEI